MLFDFSDVISKLISLFVCVCVYVCSSRDQVENDFPFSWLHLSFSLPIIQLTVCLKIPDGKESCFAKHTLALRRWGECFLVQTSYIWVGLEHISRYLTKKLVPEYYLVFPKPGSICRNNQKLINFARPALFFLISNCTSHSQNLVCCFAKYILALRRWDEVLRQVS